MPFSETYVDCEKRPIFGGFMKSLIVETGSSMKCDTATFKKDRNEVLARGEKTRRSYVSSS
jgi:hypothetical protein